MLKKGLLILLCLPLIWFGQGWIKGYFDTYDYSVTQTNDRGYILAGGISPPNNHSDIWLLKTDENGNTTSTFNIPISPNRKLLRTVKVLGK